MNSIFECVGVGGDSQLWHTIRTNTAWQPNFGIVESQVAGGPTGFRAVGGAGVGDDLQIVGVGSDSHLWHTIRFANGSWQPTFGPVAGQSAGGPAGFSGVAC